MTALLDLVEADILSRQLARDRERILVAVSGGLDSMVLLDLLHRLAARHEWTLGVAHFNHRLRGSDSIDDENLVRARARELGLPFTRGQGNVRSEARHKGASIEMAARNLRHRFLARLARRNEWGRVALAHHADDQVELFFLRLLRGASPEGLSGMTWCGPSPVDPAVTLIRPLLGQPRAALQQYSWHHGLAHREDRSNRDTDILRNRIRRRLLPLLARECQPALSRVILRTMEVLGAESDALEAAARKWCARRDRRGFRRLPLALQRRIVLDELLRAGVPPAFEVVERLLDGSCGPVQISPGLRLALSAEGRLLRLPDARLTFNGGERRFVLRGQSGSAAFGDLEIRWRIRRRLPRTGLPSGGRSGEEWFDAAQVGTSITLRHWRRGDRFQPIGTRAPGKLQDLFVNLKVPKALRHQRVVAADANGVLFWVEGMRIGERAKVTVATARYLHWRWTRSDPSGVAAASDAPADSEVAARQPAC